MRPVSRRDADARNPMNPLPARRAVKDESAELSLKIRFHVQQLESEHLCLERHWMRSVDTGLQGLVHEGAGRRRLLADDPYSSLKYVALSVAHRVMLRGWYDLAWNDHSPAGETNDTNVLRLLSSHLLDDPAPNSLNRLIQRLMQFHGHRLFDL